MNIDFDKLEIAIDNRHHAMERFFDIDAAEKDREMNLEMMERLKNGMGSRQDEESALTIIDGI